MGKVAAVRQAGLVARDVEIRKADLEDVFLDVMKKNHEQTGASFAAGPPQGETAPLGGSAAHAVASVGATNP